MEITERQKKILKIIIRNYINLAQPISSQFLEKKYRFGVCPATIRNEMQKLSNAGFIFQPHTSAGRVPTDKGYRFFVDSLLEESLEEKNLSLKIKNCFEKKITSSIKFLQIITKNLSLSSSSLAMGYLFEEKILWKDGWEEIIKGPEFAEKKNIESFIKMIESFEEKIDSLEDFLKKENASPSPEESSAVKVYIGKESPFAKTKEFSIIIGNCRFPDEESAILAILGPKRMDYDKNIGLMNSLAEILS